MSVLKVNTESPDYDIVVKTLRRRQVACKVSPVTPKHLSKMTSVELPNSQPVHISPEKNQQNKSVQKSDHKNIMLGAHNLKINGHSKSLSTSSQDEDTKARVKRLSLPKKCFFNCCYHAEWSKSFPELEDDNALFSPMQVKKRKYNKKLNSSSTPIQVEKRKYNKKMSSPSPIQVEKRKYNKKKKETLPNHQLETPTAELNVITDSRDGEELRRFDIPNEGVQHQEVILGQIPKVPHNTPIYPSFQNRPDSNTPVKRGRGRPPLSSKRLLITPPPSSIDEETTGSSMLSQDSSVVSTASTPRRRHWKHWYMDLLEAEQEEEPVSEYELQRQRNIEENMKMLKQIFMDKGLEFEEDKSSSTPKIKKPYNRHPLPPPRPKSARIEDHRNSEALDFSKLTEQLNIP